MNALKVVAAKLAAGIGTRPLRLAHYWRWALAVWCACLATTAGFQIIVDPYCAYGGWSGFDRYKLFAKRDEAKAETLIRLRPHTLILGTSRAMAFNPASPLWGPQPAFNLGLPAAPQQRVAQAFETASLHAPVKRVFLCVDFYQYGCDPSPRSFHRSRLSPDFSAMRYHFDNLFSQKSFEASQEVVRGYLLGKPSDFTPWTGLATGRFHTQRRPRDLFVSMAEGYAKIYESYGRRESEFAALARIVRTCREREIELIVATAPVHAVHLEILH
ncbi:MAG TPA: hypothetical protein VGE52_03250, partial [Pirellulales bacterium]